MKKKHICPVCGFEALKEPAFGLHNAPSYEICPKCGFESGYDGGNVPETFNKFRERWIKNGRKKVI
jgi:ribosomal protein L37E